MQTENSAFTNRSGQKIFQSSWLPASAPQAVVCIIHGLGEHSGRYAALAESLAAAGFACFALDHPAHGKSDGQQCFIPDFSLLVETARQFIDDSKQRYPDLPSFVIGHSMGGVITTTLLTETPQLVNGAILSGPALATDEAVGPIQRIVLNAISRLFPEAPTFQLDPSLVCSDVSVVDNYLNDPLVFSGKIPARTISEIIRGADSALKKASKITTPLLLLHGENDKLASPEGSKQLYRSCSSEDKELIIYPALFHEIFQEPRRHEIFSRIADWIGERR
ncbi:alpha/beta hydrolase [Spongiibacter sp. UBA1325]|jgi:alpha-beta hydrolase superfamily lysophospholipase|uniref:alpha/beta hydrolase n=1 Tax=Spongiibacter sp. UBA1325 TaxID=1947543 RepID=UPI00257C20DF|nr:alpha/beta hydrolase [Spongiibacter sp. UBA1325]|tara:strand:- start:19788 stop:20621 length:834 start_codon:yes stop_codon:yes gene_type:complete